MRTTVQNELSTDDDDDDDDVGNDEGSGCSVPWCPSVAAGLCEDAPDHLVSGGGTIQAQNRRWMNAVKRHSSHHKSYQSYRTSFAMWDHR